MAPVDAVISLHGYDRHWRKAGCQLANLAVVEAEAWSAFADKSAGRETGPNQSESALYATLRIR